MQMNELTLLSSDLPSGGEEERSYHLSRMYHIPDHGGYFTFIISSSLSTTMLWVRYESPYFIDKETGYSEGNWPRPQSW